MIVVTKEWLIRDFFLSAPIKLCSSCTSYMKVSQLRWLMYRDVSPVGWVRFLPVAPAKEAVASVRTITAGVESMSRVINGEHAGCEPHAGEVFTRSCMQAHQLNVAAAQRSQGYSRPKGHRREQDVYFCEKRPPAQDVRYFNMEGVHN